MTEPLLMLTHTILPPIDGKYARHTSKSTERHRREKVFKLADKVQLSVTTFRRCQFIWHFGSPEIKAALDNKTISISKAYNILKAEQDVKVLQFFKDSRKRRNET